MVRARIGIIANTQKAGAAAVVQQAIKALQARQVSFVVERETAELARQPQGVELRQLADQVDLLLLFGGDGTLLHLARQLGSQIKPTAAVNIGTLGFLTLGTAEEVEDILDLLVEERYQLSYRDLIAVELNENGSAAPLEFALNEVAITRGEVSRLVHIDLWINEGFVTRYSGDGVVIATPTGSTAYALSAGGPIIVPDSNVWSITPVATHSLSSRPLVVPHSAKIELVAPAQRDRVYMTIDGQLSKSLSRETRVRLRQAEYSLPLITHPEASFFGILRQKLDWSGGYDPSPDLTSP